MYRNRKGFTLIELLIVVVIIGILAAIAIPKFAGTKEKAYVAGLKSDLSNLVLGQESYFVDKNAYATAISDADLVKNFVPTAGNNLTIVGGTPTGWSATATHAGASGTTCGVYVGTGSPPGSPALTNEGAVGCW